MKRGLVLSILLLTAGAAGCLGGDDGADDEPTTDAGTASTPEAAQNGTSEPSDQAEAEPADLSSPPTWSPGTWWEVEVQDANTGETHTITRVVAAETNTGYRVGMPTDAFSHPTIIAHFPGMGAIDGQTLGFSVHGEPFQPLSFPLEEGQTWSTTLYETDLDAEVLSASDGVADVGMSSEDGFSVNLTYDTEARAVTQFEGPLGASMQVVDHGEGFEGEVKVPHDREQFIDGRIIGAFDFQLQPAAPTGAVDVGGSFDEASFAQIVGNVNLAPGQPGHYQETTTDPAGETTDVQVTQVGGGLTANYGSSQEPAGEWSFEHVAGGVGAAATEIIAYQTQTVQLPTDTDEPTTGS